MASKNDLRILIVCEHASARFGGEAALPLHWFRVLEARGHHVWLVTHARTREELRQLYGDHERIHYIEDQPLHRLLWRLGAQLPTRLAYFTTGMASRWVTQILQRRIVRQLVKREDIHVVHQPMPVSPKEPSWIFGVGAPVVIGPMNGGMDYPPAFARHQNLIGRMLLASGRATADVINRLIPGKRRSAVLLVANERTRQALPGDLHQRVLEMVENGVNLKLWAKAGCEPEPASDSPLRLLFMGRLIRLKAVDLLLLAFARASACVSLSLTIAGDGDERESLLRFCEASGLLAKFEGEEGKVYFAGWQSQEACAVLLRRSSVLVLPSLMECGGAVVLEAMAASRPVIATAWGGPADYLDASCGVLVQPVSRESFIDGFAQAMIDLASHQRRVALGTEGYAKVARMFDWEIKVDRMLEIYRLAAKSDAR